MVILHIDRRGDVHPIEDLSRLCGGQLGLRDDQPEARSGGRCQPQAVAQVIQRSICPP
jgi:hypothetical protein